MVRYRLLSVRKASLGFLWVRVQVSGPGFSFVRNRLLSPVELLRFA